MSQAQTPQTPPQSRVNQVKVSKKTYNIIRSIVESSTKPTYEFNKPIYSEHLVRFVKYRRDLRFWEIGIAPMIINKNGTELLATSIIVGDSFGRRVAELRISEHVLDSNKHYVLKLGDTEIEASSIHEFEQYTVVPDVEVPYAVPVSLGDFVNKLMFYKSLASR
jgi:hypothetical protein